MIFEPVPVRIPGADGDLVPGLNHLSGQSSSEVPGSNDPDIRDRPVVGDGSAGADLWSIS